MSLAPGARLGPFEIIAAIGAGGMGELLQASTEGGTQPSWAGRELF